MKGLKLFLLCALVALFGRSAEAQSCANAGPNDVGYGREAIPISSTAVGFTATKYADGIHAVKYAQVTLESNNIRVSVDGLDPTATVGELWQTSTNVKFFVCGAASVKAFKAIRTSSDAAITVTYFAGTN